MGVARFCVHVTIGPITFGTSSRSWTEHREQTLFLASIAFFITFAPSTEGTKAHLSALLRVAVLFFFLELPLLALLPTVLGLSALDEPACLLATTTLLRAL